MKSGNVFIFFLASLLLACQSDNKSSETIGVLQKGPIALHPENPHYFLYKGKPLALVTSAEHYGALVNQDFDYEKYLKTLSEDGMNYTRIFTGTYFETTKTPIFEIEGNTLAPKLGREVLPWTEVKTDTSEGPIYDLTRWNEAYYKRLKALMAFAQQHDIIVEVTLFSSMYKQVTWDVNPQNPVNNINIEPGEVTWLKCHTLDNGTLLQYQLDFVEKLTNELNAFDNFFFELQNEPWADRPVAVYNIINREELLPEDHSFKADFADGEALEWQQKIATTITETEKALPKKHLIAQNYANYRAPIAHVSNEIDIINFHYAWPDAVRWNYQYNKVVGFDESGFAGSEERVYRRQAWRFMLSGGGLFNNLDYSFYAGKEDGTGEINAPGGGGVALRKQLRILSEFLHGFPLEKMKPDNGSVISSKGLIPYVLSDRKALYAIYLRAVNIEKSKLKLQVGDDALYNYQLLNTVTGTYSKLQEITAHNGTLELEMDTSQGELALKIVKVE